jgi:hypothetical protein
MHEPSRLDRFLGFSAEVTAFPVFELRGTGLAEIYLNTIDEVVGPALIDELLDAWAALPSTAAPRPDLLRRHIFGNAKLGPVARNIVKLWYVGTWYQLPTAWSEAFGLTQKDVTFVVSPTAYVEGLLWTAIGAHPSGAKGQGFGSWADPPDIPKFG